MVAESSSREQLRQTPQKEVGGEILCDPGWYVRRQVPDVLNKMGCLPLLFVYFQVNNGVLYFLDYEDIYIMVLSVLVSILYPNRMFLPLLHQAYKVWWLCLKQPVIGPRYVNNGF